MNYSFRGGCVFVYPAWVVINSATAFALELSASVWFLIARRRATKRFSLMQAPARDDSATSFASSRGQIHLPIPVII